MTLSKILKQIDQHQDNRSDGDREIKELWICFGQIVRERRKRKGIGLKDFASLMGFSRAMCCYLESGKREWNFSIARKAVRILSK